METEEIQEIEKKKRFLKRYKKNKICIDRLEEKLFLLTQRIISVKTPNYSGMPRGGNPVTIADLTGEKADLEDRILRLKLKGQTMRREILDEIDSLEDYRHVEVLESFFIDCLTLEDIADEQGYNLRHVYRLYSEGVKLLALSEHKQTIT